jgi:hypothetical protein
MRITAASAVEIFRNVSVCLLEIKCSIVTRTLTKTLDVDTSRRSVAGDN